jgi:hypothetical protein
MAQFCTNATQARVSIFYSNGQENITLKNVPVDVSVQSLEERFSDCGVYRVSGRWRFKDSSGTSGDNFTIQVDSLKGIESETGLSNNEIYLWRYSCSNARISITNGFGGVFPGYSYTKIDECPCNGCRIEIRDNQNAIVYQKEINTNCPKYEVACDQDCPEGYIKCDSPNYPGFCCIPCSSISQKINGLANRIRR